MSEDYARFKIVTGGHGSMKVIKPTGKGSVPAKLSGMYTSSFEAKRAIDSYVKQERDNGKKNSTTTV